MENEKKQLQRDLASLTKDMLSLSERIDKLSEPVEQFKDGQWVKLKENDKCLVRITNLKEGGGYGSDVCEKWYTGVDWSFTDFPQKWELATNQEVRDMLEKQAKLRGFEDGVEFKSAWDNSKFEFTSFGAFVNDGEQTNLVNNNIGSIFYNGKWAEIIEDSNIVLHGYEIEIDDTHVKFGCRHFDQDAVRSLLENMIECDINSITIESDGEDIEVSKVDIKEIVQLINNYKNK